MTKLTKWHVRPAKTQLSLEDWADAQVGLSLRLTHRSVRGFVVLRLFLFCFQTYLIGLIEN